MTDQLPAIPQPDLKVDLNRDLSVAEGAALRAALDEAEESEAEAVLIYFG